MSTVGRPAPTVACRLPNWSANALNLALAAPIALTAIVTFARASQVTSMPSIAGCALSLAGSAFSVHRCARTPMIALSELPACAPSPP